MMQHILARCLATRVYTMDVTGTKVVVGMAARHVYVWDLRNATTPSQKRESSLKYQTRCLRCTPDGTGVDLIPAAWQRWHALCQFLVAGHRRVVLLAQ